MRNVKLIACEPGNFDTKLLGEWMIDLNKGEYLEEPITVLNMISVAHNRRALPNNLAGTKDKKLINLLDVTIETEIDPLANGRWFVGGLAFKEGKKILKPNRKSLKSTNPQTIISMLTTIAYSLYDPSRPKSEEVIKLSSLLPTEEFFPKKTDPNDYEKIFREKLAGTKSKVIFHDPAFQGAEITINITEVLISPEGVVAQVASLYNWDATVKKELQGYEKKRVMNIDFGSIDTNVSILEEGDFVGNGIFGFKGGTTEVLKEIAADINEAEGHLFDTYKLDYHIRTGKPLLLGDKDITQLLEKSKNERFNQAGWTMANDINSELEDRGINSNEISLINFTGGGTQFFRSSVEPLVKGIQTRATEPVKPRYANVEGALKQLIFERIASEATDKEVFED